MTNNYTFRRLRPTRSKWITQQADSLADAVQEWHYHNVTGVLLWRRDEEKQYFAVFCDPDGNELVSRICCTGIFRKGKVGGPGVATDLEDVAKQLGWDPAGFADDWIGDEPYVD